MTTPKVPREELVAMLRRLSALPTSTGTYQAPYCCECERWDHKHARECELVKLVGRLDAEERDGKGEP